MISPVAVADGDGVAAFEPQDLGMGGVFPVRVKNAGCSSATGMKNLGITIRSCLG